MWEQGTGSQDSIIAQKLDDHVVIAFHTTKHGRGWTSTDPATLLTLCQANGGLYEVLCLYPRKLYFDVDFNDPPSDFDQEAFLASLKSNISEVFPNIDLAISGSLSSNKASYHLVATNYVIRNDDELEQAKMYAKGLGVTVPSLDGKVYTKNRQMKLPNQSKPHKPVQEIISAHPLQDHLISCFFNDTLLPMPKINTLPPEQKINIEVASYHTEKQEIIMAGLPNPKDITWDELALPENADKLLALIPISEDYDHSHSYRVANFCAWNGVPKAMFLSWLSSKDPSCSKRLEKYNKYHWDNIKKNPAFKVTQDRMRSFLPNWYPDIQPVDSELNAFKKNWYPENTVLVGELTTSLISTDKKFIGFSNPMGMGKTNMLIQYFQENPELNMVWVNPRITLTDDTVERMTTAGLNVTHYGRLGSAKIKAHKLKYSAESPNPVIVLNSLHLLWERDVYPDVIVFDELETMLTGICSDFLSTNKPILLQTLQKMIQNAKKVIFLDAFITKRTTRFLQKLCEGEMVVYDSPPPPTPKRFVVELKPKFEDVLQGIVSAIVAGRRLVVFYPFKKTNSSYPSMEIFVNTIATSSIAEINRLGGMTDISMDDFVGYNGDSDQVLKKDIKDVNKAWATKRMVCYNTIITAGVSYSAQGYAFDDCYMFVAPFNSPRDIAQASARARQLTSNTIYLKWLKGFKPAMFANDCSAIKKVAYAQLYKDTMTEQVAPNKHALMMFFYRANYEIKDTLLEIVKDDCHELTTSVSFTNIYSWDAIEMVTRDDFNAIVLRKLTLENTILTDVLSARKFVFVAHFRGDTPEPVLRRIWDGDLSSEVKPLFEAINNPDSFESHLARDNGWAFFPFIDTPTHRWNVVISEKARELIFDQWAFVRFKRDTTHTAGLVQAVYNGKYGGNIVEYKKDYDTGQKKYFTPESGRDTMLVNDVASYYHGIPS